MKQKTVVFMLILFIALLLFASCDFQQIQISGKVYYTENENSWNEEMWQEMSGINIYYSGEKLASTDENGEFSFSYDVSDDVTYFFELLTVDEPYEIKERREEHTQKRNFKLTLVLTSSYGSSIDNEKLRILSEDEIEEHSSLIQGYVLNPSYDRMNIELFFGEGAEYNVPTDEEGNFSFYYIDYNDYEPRRIVDFLQPDIGVYKYEIFTKQLSREQIICFLLVDDKESDFNMESIVDNVYFRCSFDQSGVILPAGYPSQQKDLDAEIFSIEGVSTMSGVELYANGDLIAISDESGFHLDFLIKNTEIKFVKEGFSFKIRFGQAQPVPLEDDAYFFTGEEAVFLEFRGNTDNMEILKT